MQSEETGTDGLKTQTEAAEADEIRTQAAGVTVTLSDSIKTDGCLHAEVTGITDGETVQVKWWKSADKTDGSWTEVTRKKITEDRYNISEDRKSLNVALDGGARFWYKAVAYTHLDVYKRQADPVGIHERGIRKCKDFRKRSLAV